MRCLVSTNSYRRPFSILSVSWRTRRVATYSKVAQAVGTHQLTVLPRALSRIRDMCLNNGRPALTPLVLNKATGKPGEGFLDPWLPRDADAAQRDAKWHRLVADVYELDWSVVGTRGR